MSKRKAAMKRLRTKNNDNETLCWKCDNCTDGSKCEWALGRPVKGWEATPTAYPDSGFITHSFMVTKCPKYVEARRYEMTLSQLCRKFNVARNTTPAIVIKRVSERLQENGYTVEQCKETGKYVTYAVKKI